MRRRATGIAIGFVAICAIIVDMFMLFFKPSMDATSASDQSAEAQANASKGSSSDAASASDSASDSASASGDSAATSSGLADGTYTGELVSTNRGDVQVQITVSAGTISTVTAITYPSETQQSRSISARVIPTYEQEAVTAQSADIKLVSGATETYTGFTGSLQDAINQAESRDMESGAAESGGS
jgi:uncharacterized protein with FMN-binding domain